MQRSDLTPGDRFWHRDAPNVWFTVRARRRRTVLGDMGLYGVGELTERASLTYRQLSIDWKPQRRVQPIGPDPMVTQS